MVRCGVTAINVVPEIGTVDYCLANIVAIWCAKRVMVTFILELSAIAIEAF